VTSTAPSPARPTDRARVPSRARSSVARLAPGVLLCLGVAAGCTLAVRTPSVPTALASPLLLAIVLGALVAPLGRRQAVPADGALGTGAPPRWGAGTRWSATHLLRAGVVLLGLRLSVPDVLGLGWRGAVVVVGTLLVTFTVTLGLGRRLQVPRATALLMAAGFSVCGAAAASTVASVLPDTVSSDRAGAADRSTNGPAAPTTSQRDAALTTTIALVTVLGLVCVLVGPWLAARLGLSSRQAGLWIGASFPEVAHVAAAAGTVSAAALAVATVAKLARVALLAPLTAVVSTVLRRGERDAGTSRQAAGYGRSDRRAPLVPLFVVGFVACVVVRSLGILPDVVLDLSSTAATFLLVAAMFAMGLGVDLPGLARTSRRPLLLGVLATLTVTTTAGALVAALG